MRIWSAEHVFNYSWETVTKSQLQKHPNPLQPAVIATDVVSRRGDTGTGILHSHRIISSDWGLAHWVQASVKSEIKLVKLALVPTSTAPLPDPNF